MIRREVPRGLLPFGRWLLSPFLLLMTASLMISMVSLRPRVTSELSNHQVGLVVDYRDLVSLAREARNTPQELADRLRSLGVTGLLVGEFSGKDLGNGYLSLKLSSVCDLPFSLPESSAAPDRAVIWGRAEDPNMRRAIPYLSAKFPGAVRMASGGYLAVLLPLGMSDVADGGLLPDFDGLELASQLGFPVVFRPSPCVGVGGAAVALGIEVLISAGYPVRGILPAGLTVAGYPDLEPLGALIKGNSMFLAQTEFVKQMGMANFAKEAFPNLVPLHSVIKDEIFSKAITRGQLVERMIRAVHERSVRLLVVRPYDLYPGDRLGSFFEDLKDLKGSLISRGYQMGFPPAEREVQRSRFAPIGAAMALMALMLSLRKRFFGECEALSIYSMDVAACFVVPAALGLGASVMGGALTKVLGALLGALGASEGALRALDSKSPFKGAIEGFLVALVSGSAIGAMYGFSLYMLRVDVFSGVKLTLVLPPLMVMAHDVVKRRYPEGAGMLLRPPLWGELLVSLALLGALAFMAVRSDNTALVPQWELTFREWLERLLLVRPRTKELLGYPCLFVAAWLCKRGLAPRLQEVFRIGSSLAFASALNSFCHLHTPYLLTLLRGVNGLWTGGLIGVASAASLSLMLKVFQERRFFP